MSVLDIAYSLDGQCSTDRVVFTQNDTVEHIASDVRLKLEAVGLSEIAHEVFTVMIKTKRAELLGFTCECRQGRNTASLSIMRPFHYSYVPSQGSRGWGGI